MYNGKLYKCTTATTGGTWVSSSWALAVLSDDVSDLTRQISDVESAITHLVAKEDVNLIDTTTAVSGHINYNGDIVEDGTCKTTDFIPIYKGITYKVTPAARYALFFYASDKQVVSDSYMNTDTANYTFTPANNRYVKISYRVTNEATIAMKSYLSDTGLKFEEGINLSNYMAEQISDLIDDETRSFVTSSDVDDQIDAKILSENLATESDVEDTVDEKMGDYFTTVPSVNLFNKDGNLTTGFIESGGTISTAGSYANYYASDYILLPAGTYTITRVPQVASRFPVCIYDTSKVAKSYSYSGNAEMSVSFTLTVDGYVRFSMPQINTTMLISGSTIPENYVPYGDTVYLNKGIVVPYNGNILEGKKWWACGDSFTEWTTAEFDPDEFPNITVVDDRHHYATYPFWIGSRNGMTVHNYAVSGQTMAYPTVKYDGTPSSFTNAFANDKYKSIPSDVDYITLWFGINDSHHRPGSQGGDGESNEGIIELGTIDSTATNTFYGAWNTVLPYLIEHYPWAKIGIIITNGAETTDYAEAEIAVAKKWGIPYLDLNGDYKLPLMLRVDGKPDVCADAIALRKAQQWTSVAQGNGHPNVDAHKFESTFIENWLRSI